MSKQSETKLKQGYVTKAVPQVCMNCASFLSVKITKTEYGSTWTEERGLCCAIGGFAVKKMGTCDEWSGKP